MISSPALPESVMQAIEAEMQSRNEGIGIPNPACFRAGAEFGYRLATESVTDELAKAFEDMHVFGQGAVKLVHVPYAESLNIDSQSPEPSADVKLSDPPPCVESNQAYIQKLEADIALRDEAIKVLREAVSGAYVNLDKIKFSLDSSVYTLKDDEFETTFYVRDCMHGALASADNILGVRGEKPECVDAVRAAKFLEQESHGK